jgi:hypothetical protein
VALEGGDIAVYVRSSPLAERWMPGSSSPRIRATTPSTSPFNNPCKTLLELKKTRNLARLYFSSRSFFTSLELASLTSEPASLAGDAANHLPYGESLSSATIFANIHLHRVYSPNGKWPKQTIMQMTIEPIMPMPKMMICDCGQRLR